VKKRLLLISILALLLIIAGFFFYLSQKKDFKIRADETLITLNYSGKVVDYENRPVNDADFYLADPSLKTIAKAKTDVNGNYNIITSVKKPESNKVYFTAITKEGYNNPSLIQSQAVSASTSQAPSFNENSVLLPVVQPTVSSPCATDQAIVTPDLTICVQKKFFDMWNSLDRNSNDYSNIPTFDNLIKIIQTEIPRLRVLAKLSDTPRIVYLNLPMPKDWAATGYADTQNSIMRLSGLLAWNNKDENQIRSVIDHEFGHFVDTERGELTSASSLFLDGRDIFKIACTKVTDVMKSSDGTEIKPAVYKCPASWDFAFRSAFEIAKANRLITDYAVTDPMEMYAEIFASMVDPKTAQSDKLKYFIENYLLDGSANYKTEMDLSSIQHLQKTVFQNILIYIYDFVLQKSFVKSYFPVTLYKDYDFSLTEEAADGKIMGYNSKIMNANFTDKSIITVKILDHAGNPMENTNFAIGPAKSTSRLKKEAGSFSDGSGELFETTGTAIVLAGPVSDQNVTLTPPDYYNVPFIGQKVTLKPGANYLELKYHKLTTIYGIMNGPSDGVFRGIFQLNSGTKLTGTLKGSISRYPDEGTNGPMEPFKINGGFGIAVPKLPPDLHQYYNIGYLYGGSGDSVFPIKETLIGPAGSPIPLRSNPSQFQTITEYIYDPRPKDNPNADIGNWNLFVYGVQGKKCFVSADNPCADITSPGAWPVPSLP